MEERPHQSQRTPGNCPSVPRHSIRSLIRLAKGKQKSHCHRGPNLAPTTDRGPPCTTRRNLRSLLLRFCCSVSLCLREQRAPLQSVRVAGREAWGRHRKKGDAASQGTHGIRRSSPPSSSHPGPSRWCPVTIDSDARPPSSATTRTTSKSDATAGTPLLAS